MRMMVVVTEMMEVTAGKFLLSNVRGEFTPCHDDAKWKLSKKPKSNETRWRAVMEGVKCV